MSARRTLFGIFTYSYLETEAADALYIYENVEITRSVTTQLGHKLTEGDRYEAVWFSFQDRTFHFVTMWVTADPNNKDHWERVPGLGSFLTTQSDIARLMSDD